MGVNAPASRRGWLALFVFCAAFGAETGSSVFEPTTGIELRVRGDGYYRVSTAEPQWRFSGSVRRALEDAGSAAGTDGLGAFREVFFTWRDGALRYASLRTYAGRPVVLFTISCLEESSNTGEFPALSGYPRRQIDHLSFASLFAGVRFTEFGADSPWVFFDSQANTFLLSPAANFGIARMSRNEEGVIASGIHRSILKLPAGFTHQSILVVEPGINRAFDTWGHAMTGLQQKQRPANDADIQLNKIGYWTDNGASYYYRFVPELGYEGTLLAVRDEFARKGIPLGYMQLDSWFYPKGARADWTDLGGGIHRYFGAPELFPKGLRDFAGRLGVPLITHSRWIDPESPYRRQYRISGNVPVDSLYWKEVASYLHESQVVTYEQDWLGAQAQPELNLTDRRLHLGGMSAGLKERNITIQYSMPLPRHFLASTRYDNVTTIRTSQDRFGRERWDEFLYGSRLASALGLWPWADVMRSTELDNLLVATLSAGPVGVGDALGAVDAGNLLRVARPDGVIVKPDAPLTPFDSVMLADARGEPGPMIAFTYADFGGWRAAYVFAYDRGTGNEARFSPGELGIQGPAYVYDYFAGRGAPLDTGQSWVAPFDEGRRYYVVVPIGPSGMAFLGDLGHFVPHGRKRVVSVTDSGAIEATVAFAPGEAERTLTGYAGSHPSLASTRGEAKMAGFDDATGLFQISVRPDEAGLATISLRRPDLTF